MPFKPTEAQILDWELEYDSHGQLKDAAGQMVWWCGDCGRTWTSMQQGHCAGCHQHFSSDSAFDLHIVPPPSYGTRPFKTCKAADELMEMSRVAWVTDRYGGMWARPGSLPEHLKGRDG